MVARWWQHLFWGDVENQLALLSLRVSTTGYTRNSNLLITYSTVKWFSYHRRASSKQLSLTLWSNNSKLKEDIIRSLATAAAATAIASKKKEKRKERSKRLLWREKKRIKKIRKITLVILHKRRESSNRYMPYKFGNFNFSNTVENS